MNISLRNMSCASCAQKIERDVAKLPGVEHVHIDTMRNIMHLSYTGDSQKNLVAQIEVLGKQYERNFLAREVGEEPEIEKRSIWPILRLLLALGALLLAYLADGHAGLQLGLFMVSYAWAGSDVLLQALRRVRNKDLFQEHFLMSIATLGAFAIGEYGEAVAVMIFYQVGEILEDRAVDRSKKSIHALLDLGTEKAYVKRAGKLIQVSPEEVSVGETILVRSGETIPLDGEIVKGEAHINQAALTGESLLVVRRVGESVLAGGINVDGALVIRVQKIFEDSSMARIVRLMQEAKENKPPTERFIGRFASRYTQVVVYLAIGIALLPPLIFRTGFETYFYRALIFLVVSCPCALVLSVPLGFFAGMGGLSRRGILVRGGSAIEKLTQVKHVYFDKTNTLTEGEFAIVKVEPAMGVNEEDLLDLVAEVEKHSNHPLAWALLDVKREAAFLQTEQLQYEDRPGYGMAATSSAQHILVGSRALLENEGVLVPVAQDERASVYVSFQKRYWGRILLQDQPKEEAKESIEELRRLGVLDLVMLTGDTPVMAAPLGALLGLSDVQAGLLPEGKTAWLQEAMKKSEGRTMFVGDGINDGPSIALADVGVAMGIKGSDLAIEAADVVLMHDRIAQLPQAIYFSRKTMRIIRQNIAGAIGIKMLVLLLGVWGLANMWMAVFADVGVTLLAVLNSVRLLYDRS